MIAAHALYENDYAIFWIESGILFFKYKSDVIINLDVAKQVVAARIQFQNDKSYPVLCDTRGIIETDKAGRDYLAQSGSLLTKAVGLLVHQRVSITISTFYMQISKPTVPTELFTGEADAINFLKQYL
ncbi:hypothetical protein ACFSX9_13790 [Flavobacterium ardleyense]|uniref:DUF7793 domain-containing protein n=1 Tax=Flavobacterium ardleyense TaxID=2038737 RepID=A0ABW5ZBD3_9FLAO